MNKRFIYLLKCHQYYKIGVAKDVKARLAGIQTGNPYPVELVEKFEVVYSAAGYLENLFHNTFYRFGCHVRGEWFELSPGKVKVFLDSCRAVAERYKAE